MLEFSVCEKRLGHILAHGVYMETLRDTFVYTRV